MRGLSCMVCYRQRGKPTTRGLVFISSSSFLTVEPILLCPVEWSPPFSLESRFPLKCPQLYCLFWLTGHLILHGILKGQEAGGLRISSHLGPSWFPAMATQSLDTNTARTDDYLSLNISIFVEIHSGWRNWRRVEIKLQEVDVRNK